jgi:S-DNA-T family DNA segregation ATPase FtsK/SpoIIIE
VAAERPNAVQGALASLVRQRWALRLSDPTAYSAFGVRSTAVPEMVPGRALVAGSGQVVQIARPAGGVATAAARLAASAPRPARPPRTIETLGTEVRVRDLRDAAQLGTRPWSIPLGLTEEALAPATLVAYQGEHALVAGPARSGKTTTLLTVAAACRQARPDLNVLAVAGPRSTLAHHPLVGEVVRPSTIGDLLQARVDAVAAGGGPVLLLIDDAETVDDTAELLARLSTSDRPELLVVAAGRNDSVRSGYTHWTRRLRRSKLGVLLVPDVDYDGDILGTHVLRRPPVAMTAGRGYLVNSGRSELVQIALPE